MQTHAAEWLGKFDPERRAYLERALNVSNVGSVLLQTNIRRVVEMLTLREFGAQAVLPRKQGSGDKEYVNRRTAGTTGAEWVDDTDSSTEESGSYAQANFAFKTLLTKLTVTRKAIAQGRSYGDVLGGELIGKSEDFAAALESAIFTGDNAANSKQISGLLTLIGNVSGQTIANTTAAAGDDLVLSKLDEAIDSVRGSAARSDLVIFGTFAGMRKLNAALQAQQQFIGKTVIGAGFRVATYDDIPMVTTTGFGNDLGWNGSGRRVTKVSGESSNPTTALVVVNTRYVYLSELTPLTVMPLARSTSQNESLEMFWDGVLALANTKGAAILGGLSAT